MLGEYEKGLLITNQGRVMYKLTSVIPTSRMALYYAGKPTESAGKSDFPKEDIEEDGKVFVVEDTKTFEKRLHGFEERCFLSCHERGT